VPAKGLFESSSLQAGVIKKLSIIIFN